MGAFHQQLGHGCGYRGNIRSPKVSDSQVSEQGGGGGRAQTRVKIGERQMLFQLVSTNHVADHSVLTDGHLGRQLVHNRTIWGGIMEGNIHRVRDDEFKG